MNVRKWLRENGYEDIADLIDRVMIRLKAQGNGTRRNWWDVLAGRADGGPCVRFGETFPVLRAAQIRQGRPVTPNALCRNEAEEIPPKTEQARWGRRNQS